MGESQARVVVLQRCREGAPCHTRTMRFFNTTGPVVPEEHYCIPALARLDLTDVLALVRNKRYFVLHAPRQTGKTSILLALRDLLNSGKHGDYRCVYVNVEGGQAAREDTERAMRAILGQVGTGARVTLGDDSLAQIWPAALANFGPDGALGETLGRWAESDPRPLVVLIDEIDALIGDTLLSVLRQLRAGYVRRPLGFPQSVVLCGVRDVRDYRIHSSSQNAVISGGSAFNIKAKSLRLGDFCRDEVVALLAQHTDETGQVFTDDALQVIWTQSQGQPWLVNALAEETCLSGRPDQDRSRPVTVEDVNAGQERLIMRRETHLDQLADKLQEGRVRRVIEPLLSGGDEREFSARDLEYVRDLGLVALDSPLRIANPVYAEVVPRELTYAAQEGLVEETGWYVHADGRLDVVKLVAAFQGFFREHSERWLAGLRPSKEHERHTARETQPDCKAKPRSRELARFDYQEAGPQLLLQAFLQRVVNGGGRIEREYGLGRGRTDLLIVWPAGGRTQHFVIECKVLHERRGLDRTIRDGLEQTAAYMDRWAAEAGHLVIFDRDAAKSWDERVYHRVESAAGRDVHVWGM